MANNLNIIRASLEHLEIVAPLFDAYRQFYRWPPDLAGARVFLSERLSRNESAIFLAEGDGAYHGFTQLYPSFSSGRMERLWILNDLFVAPASRGRGAGAALLEHARQFALETGARGMVLETATDNLTAQRLYERLGWVRDTEFYTYILRL
jgi:GNAT superfamily N-acetyltransferase